MDVRPAAEADLEQLNELYNFYIVSSPATFDIEPITLDARTEWLTHYAETGRHRVMVAVDGGRVMGYASSSRFRPKQAYETSCETSVYLLDGNNGRGIGSALYEALFDALAGEDLHRAYAGVTMPNDASVALHEKFGFRQAGYFTQQGRKFGRYWDVAWFEKEMG